MRRILQVLGGLLVGLVIAEAVFWFRDDGAFPHLNVYQADDTLGVRLRPGATQRVRFGGNPTSSVRINSAGYRGAEWPHDTSNAIAIVGDSQVFGLGVEENESFAARLAEKTNRAVLNAGVPTLGPPEFMKVAAEIVAKQQPRTLILTINMVNDLFEVTRPNVQRHKVWDGWAVRIETAPADVTSFPGRELLMSKSHLVYALRRVTHQATQPTIGALPSEGSWKELEHIEGAVAAAQAKVNERRPVAELYNDALDAKRSASRNYDLSLVFWSANKDDKEPEVVERELVVASGNPGDILAPAFVSESARRNDYNFYQLIRAGQATRRVTEEELKITPEVARRSVEYREALQRKYSTADDAQIREARSTYTAALAALGAVRREPLDVKRALSPIDTALDELARLCHRPACEPMLVILPIDLQVDDAEWKKYGLSREEVGDLTPLTESMLASAAQRGIRALDALPVLKRAEPGAFLNLDIHMTPKGHDAVADAIVAELAKPAPTSHATGILPTGRSRVPSADELRHTPEIIVRGTGKAGCETVQVDEWLRVQCRKGPGNVPRFITVVSSAGDSYVNANGEVMSVVAPVLEGAPLVLDLVWAERTQRLTATRGADGAIVGTLDAPMAVTTAARPVSAEDAALCRCHRMMTGSTDCLDVYGSTRPECFAKYATAGNDKPMCGRLLECAQGFPASRPTCGEGTTLAGGTLQCFPQCVDDASCNGGKCVDWPDTRVCLGGQ